MNKFHFSNLSIFFQRILAEGGLLPRAAGGSLPARAPRAHADGRAEGRRRLELLQKLQPVLGR